MRPRCKGQFFHSTGTLFHWGFTLALPLLGSLRYHDSDGHENVAEKENLRSFNLYTMTPTRLLCHLRIPKNHIQVQKEKENLAVACLRPP